MSKKVDNKTSDNTLLCKLLVYFAYVCINIIVNRMYSIRVCFISLLLACIFTSYTLAGCLVKVSPPFPLPDTPHPPKINLDVYINTTLHVEKNIKADIQSHTDLLYSYENTGFIIPQSWLYSSSYLVIIFSLDSFSHYGVKNGFRIFSETPHFFAIHPIFWGNEHSLGQNKIFPMHKNRRLLITPFFVGYRAKIGIIEGW
ncbi:MAG: hypothetical protein DRG27_06250 [Deltaproteobacteria bacterium]|nr:MAG: hypothetical protein DRG27_06250 [Deltaproteobacteria bacterium]